MEGDETQNLTHTASAPPISGCNNVEVDAELGVENNDTDIKTYQEAYDTDIWTSKEAKDWYELIDGHHSFLTRKSSPELYGSNVHETAHTESNNLFTLTNHVFFNLTS